MREEIIIPLSSQAYIIVSCSYINERGHLGDTLLHEVVKANKTDFMKILMENYKAGKYNSGQYNTVGLTLLQTLE